MHENWHSTFCKILPTRIYAHYRQPMSDATLLEHTQYPYDPKPYLQIVSALKQLLLHLAFTSDLVVLVVAVALEVIV